MSVSKNNLMCFGDNFRCTEKCHGLDKLGGWMSSVFLTICPLAISAGYVLR